jgi:hypothetical protein
LTPEEFDEERFAAGFILNKLYTLRCFARKGNISHGKHTELLNMPKGFPRGFLKRGEDLVSVCRRMNGQLVLIFKSTGEDHICALLGGDAAKRGLELCNYYREKVGLPPLGDTFTEILRSAPEVREPEKYHRLTAKEKRNLEYRKGVEKWMKDEGLA